MIDLAARRLALAREILKEFGWLSGCIDPECAQCMDEISRLTIKLDQYGDALARAEEDADVQWVEANQSWGEFRERAEVGMLLELATGERMLIGDINELGGVCDDCTGIERLDVVAKYAVVFRPHKSATAIRALRGATPEGES